jgi:hypothetical protein
MNSTPPYMSNKEARLRTELYLQQRLNRQAIYYQNRIEEFNFNADQMLMISAILMGLSTVVSSATIAGGSPVWAFLTAMLPAFAAAVSAFRSLYQWERQATIYEETWVALQQARLALPDEDSLKVSEYDTYLPALVAKTEEVLRNEASQWGQLENVLPSDESAAQPNEETPTPPQE